ncbi:SDR family NAD(P)-dependent oxidoreductase [Streptomyces sp. NPDC093591]|uniref:SDR family NAD(P)-dependent oxidoreductase n=1 Tax=Streptomyces sp. NPDC093591 TaxID=3366044 RepID=UPI003808ECF2
MTKTAIVTGGAGGMGLATAKILGSDHRVVITDVNRQRLDAAAAELRDHGVDAAAVACDITSRASVEALFQQADREGSVRAVVHTAGISPQMGTADKIIRINALGTVNITEAALAVATEGFALVNLASIAGHMTPRLVIPKRIFRLALTDRDRFTAKLAAGASRAPKGMRPGLAYSLSKNFVIWYSQQIAAPFGAKGARVLSVSPGSFDTAMGRLEEKGGSGKLTGYAALKRYGRPEEIAELLAFCAGDKPGYLTGVDILCDGGTKAGLDLRGMIAMARGD